MQYPYVRLFGFRAKHTTHHQLLLIADFLSKKLNMKITAAAIFLVVANAFDKVWHEDLIWKLIRLKFPARFIYSYHFERTFRICINNILSAVFLIIASIFQGCVLGPLLFNLFVNDIPRSLHTYLALYADDASIYASTNHPYILYIQRHISMT